MCAFTLRQRLDIARGQPDLPLVRVNLDDANPDRISDFERFIQLDFRIALNLGHVREAFDAFGDTDEQAEIGDLRDGADQLLAEVMRLGEVVPFVG